MLLALLLTAAPAVAQTRGQRAPAQGPQLTDAQLRQQFRENFLRGCLSGRTQGVRNQNNYCNCYANSYLARYDGRTLAAITQLSEQAGQTGPTLVDLMMSPERQGCAARS